MAELLKVEDILSHLDIKRDSIGAEFGCGSAAFALALARKADRGRVYALDVQKEKLDALKGRMAVEKVHNILLVLADLEAPNGSTLKDNALDVVLIPNVLFQAENKYGIISEGKRILQPGGQLLVIDWLKQGPFSPKEGLVTPEDVKRLAEQAGLSLKNGFAVGEYHYALLFTKP